MHSSCQWCPTMQDIQQKSLALAADAGLLPGCLELTSWSSTAGSHSMSPSMRTANLQVLQASLSVYASWNRLEAAAGKAREHTGDHSSSS